MSARTPDEPLTSGTFRDGYAIGRAEAGDVAFEARWRFAERGCGIARFVIEPFRRPQANHRVCVLPPEPPRAKYRGPRFDEASNAEDAWIAGYEMGFRAIDLATIARTYARDACIAVIAEENALAPLPLRACIAACERHAQNAVEAP